MMRKKVGIILALNLLFIVLALRWYLYTPPLSATCEGSLTFADQRANNTFSFDGEIILRFQPDETGYLTLNGDVTSTRRSWEVSRQETFKWRHLRESLYEITILRVVRFSHDMLPPGIFEKYVAGVTLGQKRLLMIKRTPENAMVIGNLSSPLLICTE